MHPATLLAIVLLPGWAYLCAAAAAALRFGRRSLPDLAQHPPVSVLKPLHGDEPGLYDNLRSFAEQDYPVLQMVLGVADRNDTALPAARSVLSDLPQSDIALVINPQMHGSNGKISNLENLLPAARHEILVLADSDMRVDRRYLAAVAAPLADSATGIVTCLYTGASSGGIWSDLGALHINYGFMPAALLAEWAGAGNGCFGATIALRREVLDRIGGFARLRDELADDHRLGEAVRELGLKIVLSPYLVEDRVNEPSLAALWRHELRWARTVRGLAPLGFTGSILTHVLPLALIGAAATGFDLTGIAFVAITVALRWAAARRIAGALGTDAAGLWLLPVRDCLSFAVFVASFFGRSVFWRDQFYQVAASGRMAAGTETAREVRGEAQGDKAL